MRTVLVDMYTGKSCCAGSRIAQGAAVLCLEYISDYCEGMGSGE